MVELTGKGIGWMLVCTNVRAYSRFFDIGGCGGVGGKSGLSDYMKNRDVKKKPQL